MKTTFLLLFHGYILLVISQHSLKQLPSPKHDYSILYHYNDNLQYETYPQFNGWGYRIYVRYKLLINQPNIPALSGNLPFNTEADAKKIAELAASKIANGYLPPTITIEEIQNQIKLNKND